MIRFFGGLLAFAAVVAFTAANVHYAGGIYSPDAAIIIAVGAFTSVGAAFAGWASRAHGLPTAFVIVIGLLAAEAYWGWLNAEREYATRQEAEQPKAKAVALRIKLQSRVNETAQELRDARSALVAKSAERDCRKNCADMLRANVDSATRAATEARNALDALPPQHEIGTLAVQLGFEPWESDAFAALLRSIAAMCIAFAFSCALHTREQKPVKSRKQVEPPTIEVKPQPVDITPPTRRIAPRNDAMRVLAEFGTEHVRRDPSGKVHFLDVLAAYERYCQTQPIEPLERAVFIRRFAELCELAGFNVQVDSSKDAYIVGAKLVA